MHSLEAVLMQAFLCIPWEAVLMQAFLCIPWEAVLMQAFLCIPWEAVLMQRFYAFLGSRFNAGFLMHSLESRF